MDNHVTKEGSVPPRPRTLSEAMRQRKPDKASPADNEPLYIKKEKSIKSFIKDGFFTSIKAGLTDNFVMPFAIALNASTGMLAALVSVPQLVASFFQLFAEDSLRFFKTRRNLIVWTALIQSLMWLPLLLVPFLARESIWLVLLLITLEVTLGTFQGPVFNSILGDNLDEDKRGEFFGKRNRIVNLIGFVSTLIAGFVLNFFKDMDHNGTAHYVFFGFAILFVIAFIARAIASYFKSKVYDPPYTPSKNNITFFSFLKNMSKTNYGIFVFYVFAFKLAAFISAPFFALYLLRDLGMSYMQFTLIIAISIIASSLTMGIWGKLIDRHGSKFVLTIAGFLVPLSPIALMLAVYLKSPSMSPMMLFAFIFLEEAFSGAVWAAFNLSTSSFLFDATSKDERIKYIAYYNFLTGVAVFLGSMLGGVLITVYPVWIVSAIPFIYLTTGLLRLLATAVFIKKVREARMVEVSLPGEGRSFFHKVVSITPHGYNTIEVIGVEHKKDKIAVKRSEPPKRLTIDPVKRDERKIYEKRSLDYYKDNALKTLNQQRPEETPKDDSDKIEKSLEADRKRIAEMTEQIRKDQARK